MGTQSPNGLDVLAEDDGHLFAGMGPLAILLWFETPTTARVEGVIAQMGRFPTDPGFGLMTVVTPQCAPVGPKIRDLFDEGLRTSREHLLGTATVIEVKGVLGGLTRAIARTMGVISRVGYPNNVYSTVEEASAWLPTQLQPCNPPPPSPQAIIDAVVPRLDQRRG